MFDAACEAAGGDVLKALEILAQQEAAGVTGPTAASFQVT